MLNTRLTCSLAGVLKLFHGVHVMYMYILSLCNRGYIPSSSCAKTQASVALSPGSKLLGLDYKLLQQSAVVGCFIARRESSWIFVMVLLFSFREDPRFKKVLTHILYVHRKL